MAILVKGTDFVNGEQITSAKLDNLVDNATFASGSVESGGGITLNGSGQLKIAGNIDIGTSNLTATGTISLGTTSFNDNNITNVGSIALDTITNDGTDVTIDSSGDIILDADGAQIRIKDAGTERFVFNTDATPELDVSGGDFTIHANTSDADIIFTGNDGGSTITALTLDMSAAGAATFNDKITATELDISGDISVTGSVKQSGNTGNITIKGGDTDGANIELYGASHASHSNDAFYDADSHSFRPANGSSTNVIINSSGNVGIGTATPSYLLDVNDDAATGVGIRVTGGGGGGAMATFTRDVSGGTSGTVMINAAGNDPQIRFTSASDNWSIGLDGTVFNICDGTAVGANQRLAIDTSGNVGIATTSPDEKLDVVGAGRFSTGVTFGTDTAAANKLDDYEEGTWTPAITFGGGSTGVAYDFQVGTYTKIGDLVTASCYVDLSAKGSSTGAALLTGLPFTARNLTGNLSAVSLRLSNISFADVFMGYSESNTTQIKLQETTNAGTTTDLTDANFSNSSVVMMSVSYRV